MKWCEDGIRFEADPRQVEKLLRDLEMESCKPVTVPGVKPTSEEEAGEEDEEQSGSDSYYYSSIMEEECGDDSEDILNTVLPAAPRKRQR